MHYFVRLQRNGMKQEIVDKDETVLKTEAEVEMEKVYATLPGFCLVYRTQFSHLLKTTLWNQMVFQKPQPSKAKEFQGI